MKTKQLKVMTILLAMAITLGMTACSSAPAGNSASEKPAETQSAAPQDTPPKKEDGFKIAFIPKNTVDQFHVMIADTIKVKLDGLVSEGKIESWNMYDGLTDPIVQCNLLEDAINMGADLVIILPAEAKGCAPILERCKEENIPCIVVNSKTNNTDELATAFVGSDDVFAGELMAKFVNEQIPAGGGYGHLQGVIGNSAQIDRGKGIENVMAKNPQWTLLDGCEQTGEWQAEKAVRFAEDWLARYGDKLNAIICDNDDMSSAVQISMNAANRKDIVCVGVDGNEGPMSLVKNGEMLATVYQDGASQINTAVDLGMKVLNGESVAKETMIDFVLITKDNVDQYLKK